MNTATMFLTSVTCIDHAYIDDTGNIVGGSFSPDFWVAGRVDPTEQVVIDFSKCKKQIKEIIDDKLTGYDHKLWIIPGWSKCEYEFDVEGMIKITTPYFEIEGPDNMVRIWADGHSSYSDFDYELINTLRKNIPDIDFHVHLDPTLQYTIPFPRRLKPSFFNYVHGLKDSTSWGCQNIAHGHLSYVAVDSDNPMAYLVQEKIAKYMNGVIFARPENYKDGVISYMSERGSFSMKFLQREKIDAVVLPTETTVENIVAHVAKVFEEDLKKYEVDILYISEGVHKGACFNVADL